MSTAAATRGALIVFAFWFAETSKAKWFKSDPAFDAEAWARLGALHEAAAAGRLDHWRANPRSAVALAVLLDQVPRNTFRSDERRSRNKRREMPIDQVLVGRISTE